MADAAAEDVAEVMSSTEEETLLCLGKLAAALEFNKLTPQQAFLAFSEGRESVHQEEFKNVLRVLMQQTDAEDFNTIWREIDPVDAGFFSLERWLSVLERPGVQEIGARYCQEIVNLMNADNEVESLFKVQDAETLESGSPDSFQVTNQSLSPVNEGSSRAAQSPSASDLVTSENEQDSTTTTSSEFEFDEDYDEEDTDSQNFDSESRGEVPSSTQGSQGARASDVQGEHSPAGSSTEEENVHSSLPSKPDVEPSSDLDETASAAQDSQPASAPDAREAACASRDTASSSDNGTTATPSDHEARISSNSSKARAPSSASDRQLPTQSETEDSRASISQSLPSAEEEFVRERQVTKAAPEEADMNVERPVSVPNASGQAQSEVSRTEFPTPATAADDLPTFSQEDEGEHITPAPLTVNHVVAQSASHAIEAGVEGVVAEAAEARLAAPDDKTEEQVATLGMQEVAPTTAEEELNTEDEDAMIVKVDMEAAHALEGTREKEAAPRLQEEASYDPGPVPHTGKESASLKDEEEGDLSPVEKASDAENTRLETGSVDEAEEVVVAARCKDLESEEVKTKAEEEAHEVIEEAARLRAEEEARVAAEEARQLEKEETAKAEEEAAVRRREMAGEEARQLEREETAKAEEEAAVRRREMAEEARQLEKEETAKAEEEAAVRRREMAEEEAKQLEKEEAANLKAEEAAARRRAMEEAARLRAEEEARVAAEEEARQLEKEETAKAEEEAAVRRREMAEEEAKQLEKEEAANLKAEEAAARRRAMEEAARLRAEEEEARVAAEEEARRLEKEETAKAEEEAAVRRREMAEEEAKQLEKEGAAEVDEAAARRRAMEEAARLRAEEEHEETPEDPMTRLKAAKKGAATAGSSGTSKSGSFESTDLVVAGPADSLARESPPTNTAGGDADMFGDLLVSHKSLVSEPTTPIIPRESNERAKPPALNPNEFSQQEGESEGGASPPGSAVAVLEVADKSWEEICRDKAVVMEILKERNLHLVVSLHGRFGSYW